MAGFAAAIGGMAQPAMQLGQQIRGLLEQRRSKMADMMIELAKEEPDPQRRAEYLGHASDLYSGKPITKVLPAMLKTGQQHAEENNVMAQAMGGATQQPKPTPGPGAGIPGATPSPGQDLSTSGLTPAPSANPPAAQPATSPVQPVQQGQAQSLLPPGLPQPKNSLDVLSQFQQNPMMQTPVGRAIIAPLMNQEQIHQQALQQSQEQLLTQLALRKQTLEGMAPTLQGLPPFIKAAYEAQAGGLQPVNMPAMAMMPRLISPRMNGEEAPPGTMIYGTTQTPEKGKQYRVELMPMTGETFAYPIAPETAITQTPGGLQITNRQYGNSIAPVQGAIPPAMNAPKTLPTAGGGVEMTTPSQIQSGQAPLPIPGAVTPSMATTQRSNVSQQLPSGETVTATTTKKVMGIDTTPKTTTPTHNAAGSPLGTPSFQDRVKTIADTLMIPNQSESQKNSTFKQLVGPERSPLAEAVRTELAKRQAADPGPFSFDGPTAQMAQRATQTLSHISTIKGLISKLQADGQLGPVMSRWNEFWTGHIGKDLTQNQDYVKLANNLDLLTKAMGYIHGGARGGGSIQMIQSFAKKLNVEKMDADTLNGAIDAEADWISTYAHPKQTTVPGGQAIAPVGGRADLKSLSTDELLKRLVGGNQ